MRLVACSSCHAQYDVGDRPGASFDCACGAPVVAGEMRAVDAPVRRCGSCGALLPASADACSYCKARVTRSGELSLLCPECYARNSRDSRFCTACGVAFRPRPIPGEASELACVKCGTAMTGRAVGDVAVLECAECNGLWVGADVFDRLVDRAVEAWEADETLEVRAPRRTGGNPATGRVEYRRCPTCSALMSRRNYRKTSGVVVDQCHEHGTWLDADELERIAGFIRSGGLERARAAEKTTMRAGTGTERAARATAEFHRILAEKRTVAERPSMVFESIGALLSHLLRKMR